MTSQTLYLFVDRLLFGLLLVVVVCAPIPLGSNRPWAWSGLEVAVFVLVGLCLALHLVARRAVPDALAGSWPVMVLFLAWLALQALHIAPLPSSIVELLSPESARMQRLTDILGVSREQMTLSVDSHASREALLKGMAYVGVFALTLALVNSRTRVLILARVLVYSALLHAFYAVLLHLADVTQDQFGTVVRHGSSASGTYVNRNHFAGYLEMMLALGVGLLIADLSDRRADTWKRFFRHLIEWILSPKMALRLALCVLVIALTTTHSRMGNTAFFSALLIAGVIGIVLSRHATRNTVILLVSLVAIDLFIVGSWFGVEKLAQRIGETTVQDVQDREDPAKYTVPMIEDYLVFGSGPGTFYVTFPRYRQEKVTAFFDFAHNDYVQFLAESGLLGFLLLGGTVVLTLIVSLKAQWRRRDPLMRGMSFACIMGVTSILIHSWVDFNLQIPANAILFMVLLALGWISLYLDRDDPRSPRIRSASP